MELIEQKNDRELRAVNRQFSLGEYGQSWTKLERYLFIEIYNVIKDFYMSVSDQNIKTFSSESIYLTLPVERLDQTLFKLNQKNRDLMNAAEGLSKKQINLKTIDDDGQHGFDFISMFPRLTFDPKKDKNNMYVRVPSEVYEEMVPIESYCLLDLKMISQFNSGNTVRLYEIFKSYAFKKKITLTFDSLRKQLGFFNENVYPEWKHFNAKVLKKAVTDINSHKEFDIEIKYKKKKGVEDIEFEIITHKKYKKNSIQILNLNELIIDRTPSLIQSKYIETTLVNCNKSVNNKLNIKELTEWVISDLVSAQSKLGFNFNFKYIMNSISLQIRKKNYTKPFSHKHLASPDEIAFSDVVYQKIKKLVNEGRIEDVLDRYSDEEIIANQFSYLLIK
jgi:hypothetical protein